ncbi:hypothetical protein F4818DRAFT_200207 [Hypoxylon cercidicola]|nr:hypothetical protein F4818DRAFT_200207 [Hypoxylon cercidicola]
MLTMTRIPSDSFLPSGAALDPSQRPMSFGSLNDNSTSVISPLSLPHALHSLNFLDESTITNLPSPNYSHSPSVSTVPRPRQQLFSPRQSLPLPNIREQRSASLSPTRHRTRSGMAPLSWEPTSKSSVTSPSNKDRAMGGLEQERYNMERAALMNLLRRREEQTRKLFENWQAERAYLEASRNRAEELFEEERKIMSDERIMWLSERTQLKEDAEKLKEQAENWQQKAEALVKERDQMAGYIKRMQRKSVNAHRAFDGAVDAAVGSIRGGGADSPGTNSESSSKLRTPSDGLSPGSRVPNIPRGQTMPESQPFIPLDPRMQGLSPSTRSPTQQAKIPSIDIQEVIPSLEGIRVKAGAVQKPTFTDETLSAPGTSARPRLSMGADHPESTRSRTMPAVTQEALQAPEAHRLIMHAGHTPNHSMSLSRLHTVESTHDSTEVTNTTSSSPTRSTSSSSHNSGVATPTHPLPESSQSQAPEQLHGQTAELGVAPGAGTDSKLPTGSVPGRLDDYAVPVYGDLGDEQDQDPPLKGPLFLRNLPAADEPFIQQLSEKLTLVKDNDLAPTVLKNDLLNRPIEPVVQPKVDALMGGDGAHDVVDEEAEDEEEIPLKLKKTSNFGAPLGQLGK